MDTGFILLACAYLLTAIQCVLAGMREQKRPAFRRYSLLFFLLGLVLGLIWLQLVSGWLSEFTQLLRERSRVEGWYQDRRPVQIQAVQAVLLAGAAVMAGLLWWVRRNWKRYLLVLIALSYLICFAAVRAISFHNIDFLLRAEYGGVTLRTWGNWLGLVFAVSALLPLWEGERPPEPPPGDGGAA